MKGRKNIIILLTLLFLLMGEGRVLSTHPEKTINKAFRLVHKSYDDAIFTPLDLVNSFPPKSKHDTVFLIESPNVEGQGFMVISSAKGRFDMFEFVLVFNKQCEIQYLSIITYRSEYGGEVSSRGWLNQFSKHSPGTEFKYGDNIDAISGATFSARSLTNEINRINTLISSYLNQKKGV
jgi:hypothetical protein